VAGEARRAQILAATIEVIGEVGYRGASFVRIAEHGGLSSTRLISYHFAGKEELMGAVAAAVVADIGKYMTARVGAAVGAPAMLRAYIEGVVEYVATHRAQMRALTEIVLNGAMPYGAGDDRVVVGHVEAILRQGQRDGDFREFDPVVVATAIQRAVDGLPFLLAAEPEFDCVGYGRELVELFDLGTRKGKR
jgi:AcrR family transcriptional regulator